MNIHLNGFNQQVATLIAGEPIEPGAPVAIAKNENNTIYNIGSEGAGDFIGICMNCRKGRAAVQLQGYMELPTNGASFTLGVQGLTFNDSGVVEPGGDRLFTVLNCDEANCLIGVIL